MKAHAVSPAAYLAVLGASATLVGIIAGGGELLGVCPTPGLRQRERAHWKILAYHSVRLLRSNDLGAAVSFCPELADCRSADRVRACRQSHPQSSARRYALACRETYGIRLGLRPARSHGPG